MKKALIIIPDLKKGDGITTVIMNYYNAVKDGGWSMDFMVLDSCESEWNSQVQNDGNNVFVLPKKNKYSKAVTEQVIKEVRSGKYDLLHVNIPGHIAYVALQEANKIGIPVRVFHCHNPKNTLSLKTTISTAIYDHLCFRLANRFIACSESAGKDRFGKKKYEILKNVIEPEEFAFSMESRRKIREKLHLNDRFVVGMVGRFSKQKNPEFLMDCFLKIHEKKKDAFLLWVGDGEMMDECKNKLTKAGLGDDFAFVGRKSKIGEWYSAMDVFLLPSRFEGLGIAFLEAQCSGLHCFGSDRVPPETEITELMHRVSLNDGSDEWASRILHLADSIDIEDRRHRGQDFIKAGYTHESTKNDMLELYDKWYEDVKENDDV